MMKTAEKIVVIGALVATAIIFGVVTVNMPHDQGNYDERGDGDDQQKEGLGLNAAVDLGLAFPEEHTLWHYGGGMPGQPLPEAWTKHRLGYPKSQFQTFGQMMLTPMNHPAFPKRDICWYYKPPADQDF
jgi:hypothetical protein